MQVDNSSMAKIEVGIKININKYIATGVDDLPCVNNLILLFIMTSAEGL